MAVTSDGWWRIRIADVRFAYKCDGKAYTVFQGRTLVCHELNARQIDTVVKAGNDLLAHSVRTLSDADTTMRVEESGKTADGIDFHKTELLKKTSRTEGWTGNWRETDVSNNAEDTMVVKRTGNSLEIMYPAQQSTLTAKLDGTRTREHGPHATDIDLRLISSGPSVITETESENGRQLEKDTMTLSADGSVLTVESLQTGSAGRQVYVYRRQ